MKKLTAVTVRIGAKKFSAFMMLDAENPKVTEQDLCIAFPMFKNLQRGDTYSIG